jgi:hypothetical protein
MKFGHEFLLICSIKFQIAGVPDADVLHHAVVFMVDNVTVQYEIADVSLVSGRNRPCNFAERSACLDIFSCRFERYTPAGSPQAAYGEVIRDMAKWRAAE